MTEWGATHRKGRGQGRKPAGQGASESRRAAGLRQAGGASAGRGRGGGGPAVPGNADERRRVWGQNFFKSGTAVRRFTSQIDVVEGLPIVEVGPGSGMITKELARRGEPLTVVEIDGHWAELLAKELPAHVTMVNQDFLSWRPDAEHFRIVGNLPFGASTDILRTCLGYGPHRFVEGVFLLQLEFARKRAGAWGGNLFNEQWSPWFTFHLGLEFPRHCFRPVPKTDTATLFVDPRRDPLVPWRDRTAYQELVGAVFNTGQLTIGEAARRVNVRKPADWLRRAEVFPETRVKDLDAGDWAALFAAHQPARPHTGAGGRPGGGRPQGGRGGRPSPGGGPPRQQRGR